MSSAYQMVGNKFVTEQINEIGYLLHVSVGL